MLTAAFIGSALALKQWPKHAALLYRATRPGLAYMSLRLWQHKLSVKRNLRPAPLTPIWATLRLDWGSGDLTGNQAKYMKETIRFGCYFFDVCHYYPMLWMLFSIVKFVSRS